MGILSDGQFASLARQGGASRRLSDGRQISDTDPAHKDLYAVAYKQDMGHEDKHPAVGPGLRKAVHEHAERMRGDDRLDPSTMQGAWKDAGQVYLDASRMVAGRENAVAQGKTDQQKAIRDMSGGRDVHMQMPSAAGEATLKTRVGRRAIVIGDERHGYTALDQRR